MRLRLLVLLVLVLPVAFAENLVIYPLSSQDALLGVAVAEQLEQAFAESFEVIGPDVAPSLAPPIVVEAGFFSLLRLSSSLDTKEGSSLLQSLLGAHNILTGSINFADEQLEAHYFLARPSGVIEFTVIAPEDNPSELAARSVSRVAALLGTPRPAFNTNIDLSSNYADYIRAVALLGFGEIEETIAILETAETDDPELEARMTSLLEDLRAVQVGDEGSNAGLMATMSLSVTPVDEQLALDYFKNFAEETTLPVADAWVATLLASQEKDEASAAFNELAELYPFGAAAKAAYEAVNNPDSRNYQNLITSDDFATLMSVSLIAQAQEDVETEKAALKTLTKLEPSFVYPFERLSFIAFDEEDALAAGQALAVATRLEPESDLYWTNLGWAYYLLGILDQSEEASIRATELDAGQFIAFFNLGLARVVTGRLDEAMEAYTEALALDPAVDDEALLDLVNALELYPNQEGVHYALATLYEQEGQRDEAAKQFELYLSKADDPFYTQVAQQRLDVLLSPPAAIQISEGAEFGLGPSRIQTGTIKAGDRLYSSFELFTPGAELPSAVGITAVLKDAAGMILVETSREVTIPKNAIGYVIDSLGLDIPKDIAEGNYSLEVVATASEERRATISFSIEVTGQANLLRQLISRNIDMQDLDTGSSFYSEDDLNKEDTFLTSQLLTELENTAEAANEALPTIEQGRFEGYSGEQLFAESTENDIRDFLGFLLATASSDASFTFVDAYAQWALENAQ